MPPSLRLPSVLVALGALAMALAGSSAAFAEDATAPADAAPAVEVRKSSIGAPAGMAVNFRDVGRVFYAGNSGGEVYFSDTDEQGPYRWLEAVQRCESKGSGWKLPTADQLNLLTQDDIDLAAVGINASSGTWYWSSTISSDGYSIRQRFLDDMTQPVKHKFAARVRCVRVY